MSACMWVMAVDIRVSQGRVTRVLRTRIRAGGKRGRGEGEGAQSHATGGRCTRRRVCVYVDARRTPICEIRSR